MMMSTYAEHSGRRLLAALMLAAGLAFPTAARAQHFGGGGHVGGGGGVGHGIVGLGGGHSGGEYLGARRFGGGFGVGHGVARGLGHYGPWHSGFGYGYHPFGYYGLGLHPFGSSWGGYYGPYLYGSNWGYYPDRGYYGPYRSDSGAGAYPSATAPGGPAAGTCRDEDACYETRSDDSWRFEPPPPPPDE